MVQFDRGPEGDKLAYLEDGDVIRLCARTGRLEVLADLGNRTAAPAPPQTQGMGRELFALFRLGADGAEQGGSAMLTAAGL